MLSTGGVCKGCKEQLTVGTPCNYDYHTRKRYCVPCTTLLPCQPKEAENAIAGQAAPLEEGFGNGSLEVIQQDIEDLKVAVQVLIKERTETKLPIKKLFDSAA